MAPPKRPPQLDFRCLKDLYLHFEEIFLEGNSVSNEFRAGCGCKITVFDHNFFHMVKLQHPDKEKLFMRDEKTVILAEVDGFGNYTYEKQRALYLASSIETLRYPDRTYRSEGLRTAEKVFVKEYDSVPYPFTVVLVGKRDPNLLVPVTSFPATRSRIKKWTRGELLYSKTQQPPNSGGCVDTLRGFHP